MRAMTPSSCRSRSGGRGDRSRSLGPAREVAGEQAAEIADRRSRAPSPPRPARAVAVKASTISLPLRASGTRAFDAVVGDDLDLALGHRHEAAARRCAPAGSRSPRSRNRRCARRRAFTCAGPRGTRRTESGVSSKNSVDDSEGDDIRRPASGDSGGLQGSTSRRQRRGAAAARMPPAEAHHVIAVGTAWRRRRRIPRSCPVSAARMAASMRLSFGRRKACACSPPSRRAAAPEGAAAAREAAARGAAAADEPPPPNHRRSDSSRPRSRGAGRGEVHEYHEAEEQR